MRQPSLTFQQLHAALLQQFGSGAILAAGPDAPQPWLEIAPARLVEVCTYLRDAEHLRFDYLASLSGVDLGPEDGRMLVVYHLNALTTGLSLVLKVHVPRGTDDDLSHCSLPSVAHIWLAAEWHEREAYDLLGITFTGHPDPRRMLMPEDWQGHPLRKDYQEQQAYHGIDVSYYTEGETLEPESGSTD